jgi:hypothetical protein
MTALLIAATLYLGWAALLFATQRSVMFPARGAALPYLTAGGVPDGVEAVRLPFSGGTVEAWFLRATRPGPSPAVIFAHGNAELMGNAVRDGVRFAGMGASVLLVEYPGYGQSAGSPSRRSIGEVFLAAYDWLAARPDIDSARIAGAGRSLGTGAITDLARHRRLRALVLVSPFLSVAHFARRYLLPGFLARDRFDNLEVVRSFSGPVLLVHGRRDEVIPYGHSERLARASETVELVTLDCGHNDCPPDRTAYEAAIRGFLVRAGVLGPDPGPGETERRAVPASGSFSARAPDPNAP